MTYSELVQAVIDLTDRNEAAAPIQLAIAKATLKFHQADFWLRDIKEVVVTVPDISLAPRFEINVNDSLPNFRKVSYINAYDPSSVPPTVLCQFKENAPGFVKDIYGDYIRNSFYFAGDTITLRSDSALVTGATAAEFLIGYWALPKVGVLDYDSWIANLIPFGIIDEAAKEIFGSIGQADEAARRAKMFTENLQILRINDVEATGR